MILPAHDNVFPDGDNSPVIRRLLVTHRGSATDLIIADINKIGDQEFIIDS